MQPINSIITELDSLQKEIDSAKKNAAVFEGRLQESMKRLKDDFGLDSLAEAEKEVEKLEKEISIMEQDIQTKFASLKETYAW
jgi:predicted  nucleic acid-binding Zn-ribbon protein